MPPPSKSSNDLHSVIILSDDFNKSSFADVAPVLDEPDPAEIAFKMAKASSELMDISWLKSNG